MKWSKLVNLNSSCHCGSESTSRTTPLRLAISKYVAAVVAPSRWMWISALGMRAMRSDRSLMRETLFCVGHVQRNGGVEALPGGADAALRIDDHDRGKAVELKISRRAAGGIQRDVAQAVVRGIGRRN